MAEYIWACDLRGATTCDTTARVIGDQPTQFGDGYMQLSPDGINHQREVWDVVHTAVSHERWAEIHAFIQPKLATVPFEWAPPGDDLLRKWICTTYRRTPVSHQVWDIVLRFEEWFAP